MIEEWKEVPDFPGYLVSDLGRVRGQRGWVLKPRRAGDGYHAVQLCNDSGHAQRYVHRLVLSVFCGAPTRDKPEGAHLNGIKTDNRLVNLKWADPVENAQHKEAHGTVTRGILNGCAKLTEDDVRQIRRWLHEGHTHQWIAERVGVRRQAIGKIKNRQRWGHLDA